jgi:hypothetical protein
VRRLLLLAVALVAPLAAQGWTQKLGFDLIFNEGYYSDNWTGDEKTSGSLTATLGHAAGIQIAKPVRFDHAGVFAFGQQLTQRDSVTWDRSKSEDKVQLDEVLRFTLGAWVDPLASVQLKSQFIDQSDATKTRWLNPLQLLETMGAGRKFYDDSTRFLTSQLGFAARQLWSTPTPMVADAGLSWMTNFKTIVFSKNASYLTQLTVYEPLLAFTTGTTLKRTPQVDWQHELSARFNRALSGKLFFQLLYDENVTSAVRFKQTLGMGLSLTWPS